jgi:carbamoyl-phosphate synthase large subunit
VPLHSGDSNATLPFNLGEFVMQQIKDHTQENSIGLSTVGLINIQFAIKKILFILLKLILERRVPYRL